MHSISRARFDMLAGYARSPLTVVHGVEVDWYESDSGNILTLLMLDTDEELSVIFFARDLMERFRWVKQTTFFSNATEALLEMQAMLPVLEANLETERVQGDESAPMDFFTPVVKPDRLHEVFRRLTETRSYAAAKASIGNMMRWYQDQDNSFVEQFQTTAFNARVWELYIFAALVEAGDAVSAPNPAPDFQATGLDGTFFIEATTINPSIVNGAAAPSEKPQTADEVRDYVAEYLPIRFAGPLIAKLRKRYWERPDVASSPLLIAIQDFHDEMSMIYSGEALPRYLYGLDFQQVQGKDGTSRETTVPVTNHCWKGKEVESGYFLLPDSEHISAVMFNGSGTLSKFNRMAIGAGFAAPGVVVMHSGLELRGGENPGYVSFVRQVEEGYAESWMDGMDVYHNPNALHPLDPVALPGAAHHRLVDGEIESLLPVGHLGRSTTVIVESTGADDRA